VTIKDEMLPSFVAKTVNKHEEQCVASGGRDLRDGLSDERKQWHDACSADAMFKFYTQLYSARKKRILVSTGRNTRRSMQWVSIPRTLLI
jgi:hypothetical protein